MYALILCIPNLVGSSGPIKCSKYMHLPGGMENTYPREGMPNTPHARHAQNTPYSYQALAVFAR